MELNLKISPKQAKFINATSFEVLFGGAAGGGKSYGQLIDAFLFALQYPKSKQLILRRTFAQLEKSLIRTHLQIYPKEIYSYNTSGHVGRFKNGSIIDFGYCDKETDVFQYQSAEYDVIRFDEATHFTEYMYLYLISRCRGANKIPKHIKSSTNPGNVGHTFFKERFIDPAPPGTEFTAGKSNGSRIFIPSLVQDNQFLLESDPDYVSRLQELPEKDRNALLYGDWNIFEGRYFTEFSERRHVLEPYEIPKEWRRFASLDYGLDMFAYLLWAVNPDGTYIVTDEIYEPNLIISAACEKVKRLTDGLDIYATFAPKDLWGRSQESGRSRADIFRENGVPLTEVSSMNRKNGWANVKEWLHYDEERNIQPALLIFDNCVNLRRTLPALQYDEKDRDDVATEPHELTHAPDALRYGLSGRVRPGKIIKPETSFFERKKRIYKPYGVGEQIHII